MAQNYFPLYFHEKNNALKSGAVMILVEPFKVLFVGRLLLFGYRTFNVGNIKNHICKYLQPFFFTFAISEALVIFQLSFLAVDNRHCCISKPRNDKHKTQTSRVLVQNVPGKISNSMRKIGFS